MQMHVFARSLALSVIAQMMLVEHAMGAADGNIKEFSILVEIHEGTPTALFMDRRYTLTDFTSFRSALSEKYDSMDEATRVNIVVEQAVPISVPMLIRQVLFTMPLPNVRTFVFDASSEKMIEFTLGRAVPMHSVVAHDLPVISR